MYESESKSLGDLFELTEDYVDSQTTTTTLTAEQIIAQAKQRATEIRQYEITTPNQFFLRAREALDEVEYSLRTDYPELWREFREEYNEKKDWLQQMEDNLDKESQNRPPSDPWWKQLCRVFRKLVKSIHDFIARIMNKFIVNPIVGFFEDRGIKIVKQVVEIVGKAWNWLFDRLLDFLEDGCNNFFRSISTFGRGFGY